MPCSTGWVKEKTGRGTPPGQPLSRTKASGKFYRPRNHETPFFKVVRDF